MHSSSVGTATTQQEVIQQQEKIRLYNKRLVLAIIEECKKLRALDVGQALSGDTYAYIWPQDAIATRFIKYLESPAANSLTSEAAVLQALEDMVPKPATALEISVELAKQAKTTPDKVSPEAIQQVLVEDLQKKSPQRVAATKILGTLKARSNNYISTANLIVITDHSLTNQASTSTSAISSSSSSASSALTSASSYHFKDINSKAAIEEVRQVLATTLHSTTAIREVFGVEKREAVSLKRYLIVF